MEVKPYTYWYWDKELPTKVCQKIVKLGKGKWSEGQTRGSVEENIPLDDMRKSDVIFLNEQWIYDLIWRYMVTANKQAGWKYNIVAAEDCQITRYAKDGFYNWHTDGMGSHHEVYNYPDNKFMHNNTRKLSMSIILNSSFKGGDFEIGGETTKTKIPTEKGTIIVFPSSQQHRVAPVTKGTRYSLVSWFLGPPFI